MNGESDPDLRPGVGKVLGRGLRQLCPRCGESSILDPATKRLRERCPVCALPIERHAAAALPVAYVSTALMNGLVVAGGFVFGMPRTPLGVALILALALTLMLGTSGPRRGLGVALDWMTDRDS